MSNGWRPLAVISIPFIYMCFAVNAMLAGLFGLVYWPRLSAITKTMDKLMAACMGWTGDHTVSDECKTSTCRFCTIFCKIASLVLQQDHCQKS